MSKNYKIMLCCLGDKNTKMPKDYLSIICLMSKRINKRLIGHSVAFSGQFFFLKIRSRFPFTKSKDLV